MPRPSQRSTILKLVKTDPAHADAADGDQVVAVWDPFVRLFHWSIVASFAVAWVSGARWEGIHEWAGYAAALLVVLRLGWGLLGTRHARFSDFVHPPQTVLSYLIDIAAAREDRYLGHNPAGGAMILALLTATGLTALTGWLQTTDAYYGVDWVQESHSWIAHAMLVLIALHLAGVVLASVRHRENLVRAMVTGRKRARSHLIAA